jgi:para-nitrobenzyl esterase
MIICPSAGFSPVRPLRHWALFGVEGDHMTKRWLPALLLGVSILLPGGAFAAFKDPVRIASGLVQGETTKDSAVTEFKGIPYAAPPVGDLRWRAPEPAASWQGVRKTTEFSKGCIQDVIRSLGPWTEEYMHQGEYSEDCLYLNVWTAAKSSRERRPVFVWIHGGGFNQGSTSIAVYDGEQLARDGLVVVTINYRVGLLGFMAHPELTKESGAHSSGNYGLLDQLEALKWVRKNIAAFGGDPARVAIAGQSAGASSVAYLTASPLAKGLFQRAVADSGSRSGGRMGKLADAEAEGVKFAAAKGVTGIKELRSLPVEKLVASGDNSRFRPIVDGWFLPDDVTTIFQRGAQNDVPTLTGWNADEASSNANYGKLSAEQFTTQARRQFGNAAEEFLKLYPASTPDQTVESQKASARDQNMFSTFVWARERAKTAKTNAYLYLFTHVQPGPKQDVYGAFHSSELPYIFGSMNRANRPWTPRDFEIGKTMRAYWVNFVSAGDPNGKGLPKWPAFDAKNPMAMELGERFEARPVLSDAKLKLFEGAAGNAPSAR